MSRNTKYILVGLEERHSSLNLGSYYRLDWLEPESLQLFSTSVDNQYNNYRHWRTVIESRSPWGIYTNLKTTNKRDKHGATIISADSRPFLLDPLTQTEIELLLEALMVTDD